MRRQDSNLRPPGYEPDELPTALLRDIYGIERKSEPRAPPQCVGIIAQLFQIVNRFLSGQFDPFRRATKTYVQPGDISFFVAAEGIFLLHLI